MKTANCKTDRKRSALPRLIVLALAATLMTCAFILTGCGSSVGQGSASTKDSTSASTAKPASDGKTANVVVIYSQHAGDSANYQLASSEVSQCIETEGYLDVIRLDGNPGSSIGSGTTMSLSSKNESNRKVEAAKMESKVMTALASTVAQAPEVDVFSALEYAAGSMPDKSAHATNRVALVFNGLGTKGAYDLTTTNAFDASASDYVSAAQAAGLLPNLGTKIDTVVIYGLGNTCGNQGAMDLAAKSKVASLLTAMISACGVEDVQVSSNVASAAEPTAQDLPAVSTVEFPAASISLKVSKGSSLSLDSATLQFNGDAATFTHPVDAKETLSQIAQGMADNPSLKATITGYTASYPQDPSWPVKLSGMRAQAVADALVELGVDESRLTVVAGGVGPVDDLDDAGLQIEELAQQNRCICITFA